MVPSVILERLGTYVTDVTTGAIALSGTPVNFKITLPIASGAITLTGTVVDFQQKLPVNSGAVSLTGTPVNFKISLPVDSGSVSLTGSSVNFKISLPIDAGSLSLAGTPIDFGINLPVDSGSIALTGTPVVFKQSAPVDTGAIVLSGTPLNFRISLPVDSGNIALTGSLIDFKVNLPIDPGAIVLTGSDGEGAINYLVDEAGNRLIAEDGKYLLTEDSVYAAGLNFRISLPIDSGSVSLVGNSLNFITSGGFQIFPRGYQVPALIEMIIRGGDVWADDEYNTWADDEYNIWEDSVITVNASNEGYAGDKYWDQFVKSISSPQFRTDHASGGHCKLSFGDVVLTLETFKKAGIWPPPESFPVNIFYADDAHVIHPLFTGTMHRQKLDRTGITYQLYERTFDKLLLNVATDYDGNEVPLPRAFGTVTHQSPVRLPDAGGGNRRYSAGSLQGTKHTDWHVYDDGVDICTNATAITDNVFELTVTPVGEVTVSGTGEDTTLINIFGWAAGANYLNQSFDSSLATGFTVSHWANSQEVLVSFLDRLAAAASHLFYFNSETLYLADMAADNGEMSLTENDFFPSSITFAAPVAIIKTSWTDRIAVEETIGKHIKDVPQEVSVAGVYPYGTEETADCFQSTKSAVTSSLSKVYNYTVAPRWETSLPLGDIFPPPGIKITAVDESMGQSVLIGIHARDIEYDFEARKIKIIGEGTVQ
jgi:hypothetical protein